MSVVTIFNFSHFDRCAVISHCVLICNFLETKVVNIFSCAYLPFGKMSVQQVHTSCLLYPLQSIYVNPNSCHPLPPHLPSLHICSLHLHLCSCPADRFNWNIFLDSTYMHSCRILVFLFLTSLCMTHTTFIHLTTTHPVLFLLMAKE